MIILADSSALVSFFNPLDSNNEKALEIAGQLEENSLVITRYIFAETVTVLSQRVDKKNSIFAGEYLKKNCKIIDVGEELENLAWEIFKKQKSKNVGFVDCTIFALYKKGVFDKAFSFDKDFKKNMVPIVE